MLQTLHLQILSSRRIIFFQGIRTNKKEKKKKETRARIIMKII